MRLVVVASLLVLAGCPSSKNPSTTHDGDAGVDAAGSNAPSCPIVPTCTASFHYAGPGASVVLHGDFAADGWTTGVAMQQSGSGWDVTIPANDQQVIVYKFTVDGTWEADPENTRRTPDGYGAFNSVIKVDCSHCPARAAIDWHDAIMYFVMVDRFNDGDPSNNAPVAGVELPGQYQGGDFKGVQQKIEDGYFDQLGINTLWITSPIDNADNANPGADGHEYSGYHGYWPKDESIPESHFGTDADLKAMVDAAHKHGIQVLIDYVMNHVHDTSPIYAQHPDWFWPNDNGHGGNCICGDGCSWDTDRIRCWFDTFLPDFNFQVDDARRYSVDNAVSWAKRIGIDGFRLDAVKHIETSWLTDLRARIDPEVGWTQHFYMVGETFDGNRDLIKSYVNPGTMLDGQFDFPLRGQVLSTLLHRAGAMQDLVGFLDSNDGYYGPGSIMSTFLGNHDVPRAIEHALDTPMFDPWDGGKANAWTGQPSLPTSANPFQRLQVAYTLLFTMPGIPMIYYGDEIGMPGAGDPDNRRFMQWDAYTQNQTWLRDQITALAKIRAAHPSTRRGTRTTIGVANDVFVYKMTTAGDIVFVALNRSDTDQPATNLPSGTYKDLVSGATLTVPATIPARTGLVLAPQ